jgi:hypothetical protein
MSHKQYTDKEVRQKVLNYVEFCAGKWVDKDMIFKVLVHEGISKDRIKHQLACLAADRDIERKFVSLPGKIIAKYTYNWAYSEDEKELVPTKKRRTNKICRLPAVRDKWGPWRFEDNLVLVNGEDYEIDLEQINSSAKMLDWIFQVNSKGREEFCVKSLVQAFRDIFKPQSNCCSFGIDKQFSGSRLAKQYRSELKSRRQKTRSYLKPSLRFKILHRDKYRCQTCGATAAGGADLHIDHILPVSKGGTNHESNLRVLCSECNIGRGNRYDT